MKCYKAEQTRRLCNRMERLGLSKKGDPEMSGQGRRAGMRGLSVILASLAIIIVSVTLTSQAALAQVACDWHEGNGKLLEFDELCVDTDSPRRDRMYEVYARDNSRKIKITVRDTLNDGSRWECARQKAVDTAIPVGKRRGTWRYYTTVRRVCEVASAPAVGESIVFYNPNQGEMYRDQNAEVLVLRQ